MTAPSDRHLSPELMQSYLDGDASPEEASRVQEHTGSCARCRSEMEAWSTLFHGLEDLDEVVPTPGFHARVLAELPTFAHGRPGLAARLRARFGRSATPRPVAGHAGAERLQDFLEGLLPRPDALAVEGHLHGCRSCREEVEDWRGLLASLGRLPTLAPSEAFSERVMAHVRVQLALATARPSLAERVQLLARSVSPDTRRRAAALAGAALTPAITLALVAYTVFSHPLVTLGSLVSFLRLEGSERLGGWGAALADRLTASELASNALAMAETVVGSPATAVLSLAGVLTLTLAAVWVLYRNVIATAQVEGHYAR